MARWRSWGAVLLLAFAPLGLAACGDDDDASEAGAGDETDAAEASTDESGDDADAAEASTDESGDDADAADASTDESGDDADAADASTDESGDGDEVEVSGDLPDPCGLLTAADIEAATGLSTFGEGEFNDQLSNEFQSICDWTSDDPFATAQVLVNSSAIDLEAQRTSVEDAFEMETRDVDLGVPAYQTEEGSIVGMQVDDLFVQVSYIPTDSTVDPRDSTVQMAETALANF